MAEKAAEAVDNGKPEPHTSHRFSFSFGDLIEFFEYTLTLILWNSWSAVADFNPQRIPANPASYDNSSTLGIADRVGDQVQQNAFKQDNIAADPGAVAGH
jgi:hypothetical protein